MRGLHLAELGHIQFTSTVLDYTERFNVVICHARNHVGGLLDDIRVDVKLCTPRDLPTVIYLARSFELHARFMLA